MPEQITEELASDGLLTPFQAKELLLGRCRGLLLAGKYRVLDLLGSDECHRRTQSDFHDSFANVHGKDPFGPHLEPRIPSDAIEAMLIEAMKEVDPILWTKNRCSFTTPMQVVPANPGIYDLVGAFRIIGTRPD